MSFKSKISKAVKSRTGKVALTGALVAGAVLGGASAAMASTSVVNFTVYSPGNAGSDVGYLDWEDTGYVEVHFQVNDLAADGHGPYVHYIDQTGYKFGEYHETYGSGTSSQPLVGYDITHTVNYVDVWVCNGGTSAGNAVDGCYGRRAYNQITYPGKASLSLGTTTGLIY